MSADWAEYLLDGSFAGITFDFISTDDEFGSVLDIQQLANKPGAPIKFRARKERRFAIRAVFMDDDYPETMISLIKTIENGVAEFIHPVFGTFSAAIEVGHVHHDAEDPDTATMDMTVIENTDGDDLRIETRSIATQFHQVRLTGDDVLTAADKFNKVIHSIYAVGEKIQDVMDRARIAQEQVFRVADAISSIQTLVASIQVQAQVNIATAKSDAVCGDIADFSFPEAFDLSRALVANAVALQELAFIIIEALPPLIEDRVEADIPLLAWVHAKYGDSSRVDEILALNTILDPLNLVAGSVFRRYAV